MTSSLHLQAEHAQLTLHVFDIELLLDLLRNPAYKAQQVFEKLVAGNMVTGVQVSKCDEALLFHQHNCLLLMMYPCIRGPECMSRDCAA